MTIAEATEKYRVDGKWQFPEPTPNQETSELARLSTYNKKKMSEESSSLELPRCEGGRPIGQGTTETEEGIYERANKALVELQKQFADETIIVVTHGQFARNLIAAHFECRSASHKGDACLSKNYHEVATFVNAEIRMLNI